MTTTEKYSDQQWAFIRDFELSDPTFAEFITRVRAHEAKYDQPMHGMTPADIRECEEGCDGEYGLSAESAWTYINVNHTAEQYYLLYDCGLRARAEAKWRANRVQRAKDAIRRFLCQLTFGA